MQRDVTGQGLLKQYQASLDLSHVDQLATSGIRSHARAVQRRAGSVDQISFDGEGYKLLVPRLEQRRDAIAKGVERRWGNGHTKREPLYFVIVGKIAMPLYRCSASSAVLEDNQFHQQLGIMRSTASAGIEVEDAVDIEQAFINQLIDLPHQAITLDRLIQC